MFKRKISFLAAASVLAIAIPSSVGAPKKKPKSAGKITQPTRPTGPTKPAPKLVGKAKWDGKYHNTTGNNMEELLCPGDGENEGYFVVSGGTLAFNALWIDNGNPKSPKNGKVVIPIRATLTEATAAEKANSYPSSLAMATFDEWVTIPTLKLLKEEKHVAFTKAHVHGTFVDMAPKGSDQAIMGTGRSAEIKVHIGKEQGNDESYVLVGCGGSRIDALEGFIDADPSKGNFCTTAGASCRTDAQCCSKSCSAHSTGTSGKCQ